VVQAFEKDKILGLSQAILLGDEMKILAGLSQSQVDAKSFEIVQYACAISIDHLVICHKQL